MAVVHEPRAIHWGQLQNSDAAPLVLFVSPVHPHHLLSSDV